MSREAASREVRRAVDGLGLTRLAFAERAGLDPGTLGDFLDGKRWAQAPTRRKIEQALGWPAGRIGDLERDQPARLSTSLEQAIEDDTELHPAAKAHLMNQLELLRLLPRDIPIPAREQEGRRDKARMSPDDRSADIAIKRQQRAKAAKGEPREPAPRK